jgi:hypothetical protein
LTDAGAGMAATFATEPLPLTTSDAAAHYHALQILHSPDSDESDDSELTPEELVEAIIESTCMRTLDDLGAGAINRMVNNPIFTILHTSHSNALVRFSDGTHGVFPRSDVDAAYRWIGSARLDPRALPTRATKPRDVTWIPTDAPPDHDPITTLPWLPRTFAEFQALELENPTRFLGYEVWDLLSPFEYYETVKDWM